MPTPKRKSRSGAYVHEEQRSGIKVQFRLPEPLASELARRAKEESTTPNAYAASVVRAVLSPSLGRDEKGNR